MVSNADISYRRFDVHHEDAGKIFALFEQTYGSSSAIRTRWEWEFLRHPHSDGIMVLVAESSGDIVGMTVRMPQDIIVGDAVVKGYFAANSMVLPNYRGRGVIARLYAMAADDGALQFSKGTADGMYAVLKRIGYRDIMPNSYQVCILDPVRWILQRFCNRQSRSRAPEHVLDGISNEFIQITTLDHTYDAMLHSFARQGTHKDRAYLQWRYFDIPHKKYRVFTRMKNGVPVSFVALKVDGATAYLSEILWLGTEPDEPSATIKLAKKAARTLGATKLVAWAILKELRDALRCNMFVDRGESPHFTFFAKDAQAGRYEWSQLHFAHGDGDIDYL